MEDALINVASPQVISRMLYLLNVEREDLALPPLAESVALNRAAQAHSDDMVRRGFFGLRAPSDAEGVERWVAKACYPGRFSVHIYTGPTSISAVTAWMRSPARGAILDPLGKHLGVGLSEGKWTLILGDTEVASSDTTAMPAAGAASPEATLQEGGTIVVHTAVFQAMLLPDSNAETAALLAPATQPLSDVQTGILVQKAPGEVAQGGVASRYLNEEIAGRVLDLINEERRRFHLGPLDFSGQLCAAAQEHAEDMARRDYFGHLSPEGEGVEARVARSGYPGRCGQGLAMGYLTAETAMAFFLMDAAIRASITNPSYVHVGIGLSDSRWVLVFGMPQAEAPKEVESRVDFSALSGAVRTSLGAIFSRTKEPEAGTNPTPDRALAGKLLSLINTERAKLMLHPLSLDEGLTLSAQAHSNDMLVRNYFAYTGPDGQGLAEELARAKTPYKGRTGSCLSQGQSTPEAVVKTLLSNEGNKANVLFSEYRHLGVGIARTNWTLVFGIPEPDKVDKSPQLVARLVELINGERGRAGLSGLAVNELLTRAAQAHSEDMARRNFAGSMTPEGEGPGPRADRVGYRWRSLSESTAVDRASAEAVVEGWMKIGDHRDNILDKEFRHLGVGLCQSRWTVLFAKPV